MAFTEIRIKLMEDNENEQVQAYTSPPAGPDEGLKIVPLGGNDEEEPRKTGAVDKAEEQAASGGAFPPRPDSVPTTRHTYECLAARLKALEPRLLRCFPAYCADCGLDAARQAGLRYIERVRNGTACDLEDGEAYLRVIAFRAARRCQERELPWVSIDNVVIGSEPHEIADEQTGDAVRAALAALPERQREAVTLHLLKELPLRETARVMGVAHQTVKRYLQVAMDRLRKSLAAYEKKNARAAGLAS